MKLVYLDSESNWPGFGGQFWNTQQYKNHQRGQKNRLTFQL